MLKSISRGILERIHILFRNKELAGVKECSIQEILGQRLPAWQRSVIDMDLTKPWKKSERMPLTNTVSEVF